MSNNSRGVGFLYGTILGRLLLKIIMKCHLDCIAVRFLHSSWSKLIVGRYIKKHDIVVMKEEKKSFQSYRDMFLRERKYVDFDRIPEHLISPCDGWLSVFPIDKHSRFFIKNSLYSIKDFLQNELLEKNYENGICMVFRLCASDYHHYCYIDNGYQGRNYDIPGMLHSVQPIACEHFPVYVKNKRCWCLMMTDNFGPVVQCEIGALIVGDIVNKRDNCTFSKGSEKGYFDLAGSTIVLLFEKDKVTLKPEIQERLKIQSETRVLQGEWIGNAKEYE